MPVALLSHRPYCLQGSNTLAVPTTDYIDVVDAIEDSLSEVAKRSFEPQSPVFVDGGDLLEHFQKRWSGTRGKASLENRTPLQLERDRILYSPGLRRQAEKYHVLYSGRRRIVRSYATHTMRCAQVTRAITRALNLNQDFAEAIALGSKVGATPFIHASKEVTDGWIQRTIQSFDTKCADENDRRDPKALFKEEDFALPVWIHRLESASVYQAVTTSMPWATGSDVDEAYSSGQQSYWNLCCNPLTLEAVPNQFQPETMFGIWRHTRNLAANGSEFLHYMEVDETGVALNIEGRKHATFEARVVQFADDITWAIENLEDASTTSLLNGQQVSLYKQLEQELDLQEPPEVLTTALNSNDSGALYTYFIRDFVDSSRPVLTHLEKNAPRAEARRLLGEDNGEAQVGLSETAEEVLDGIITFLGRTVFKEARVRNRRHMLAEVTTQCLRLLYEGDPEALTRIQKERAILQGWKSDIKERAEHLLKRDIYRVQAAVAVLAGMADQEIYDFVGIQAL